MSEDHLQFSPDILRRLGEELNPHVDQGIIELVRNAYDADALNCSVELITADAPGGILRVIDDGIGMSEAAIRSSWLVLGRSAKASRVRTSLGRMPVGNKGLGRLAALRMGNVACLTTRPKSEPGVEYYLALDWSCFDVAETIEKVTVNIEKRTTTYPHGTKIEVCGLMKGIGRKEMQRLARSLILLADPFNNASGFSPRLIAADFADIEQRVKDSYFEEAEFKLVARVNEEGYAEAQVFDRRGKVLFTAQRADLSNTPYETSPATFELWAFLLGGRKFTERSTQVPGIRDWLGVTGGVYIYHQGLRVYPYGDPGYDWLDMNAARVRNPEERPGTNTSIGRVVVTEDDERLIQKTDRTGFIENDAFLELKRFATDALNWMAKQRLAVAEQRRLAERTEAAKSQEEALKNINEAITVIPQEARGTVTEAIQKLQLANTKELRALREDLQLYRTLATVGITTAVFAHESAQPLNTIEQVAATIMRRGQKELGLLYSSTLEAPVKLLASSAKSLRAFAELPIQMLKRNKRVVTEVFLHETIIHTLTLFQSYFEARKIDAQSELPADQNPLIAGNRAAVESIIVNLLTNSVNAFINNKTEHPRMIRVRTNVSAKTVNMRILDSGPGITKLRLSDIWLPGQTTTPGGTGLGLTIVKDTVADLGGEVDVIANGELGGAEFIIELPLLEVKQ